MNNNIIWTIEGKINNGQLSEYKALMKEMVQAVEKEPGTTHYEWTIASNDEDIQVYERYKDAEAATIHLNTWNQFAERYLELTTVTKFTVYSELTPELEEAVSGLNPIYMKPLGGFSK